MSHAHISVRTVVIGTGFAGLGLGMRLKRGGDDDFVLLERADDVGGTWRDNTYPGVACDVPSHVYSFSFRPNPNWSRVFSPGHEIQSYLRSCAEDEGLMSHIRFGEDVGRAAWDDASRRWNIETPRTRYRARYLVIATGHLADEHLPDIPGLDSFPGHSFHSARWDHSVDLAGRRIGVVGTGASSIQVVPELAEVAGQLIVFQRTPPYVIPRVDRPYTEDEKRLFHRDPQAIPALRSTLFWEQENAFAQRRGIPVYLDAAKRLALDHLEAQVHDPHLRGALTPNYEPGCKRILISNAYYPALQSSVVTLEPSALAEFDGETAIARSGASYALDAVVFATGFEATEPPFAPRVHGRDGHSLAAHWSRGMQALDSISVHGFPNMFILNGPSTSLGHNSIVYIIEAQIDYILDAVDYAATHDIDVIEADARAEEDYVEELQRMAQGTVWLDGGCQSWYVDPRSGKLTLIWPDFGFAFRDRNSHFHAEHYLLDGVLGLDVRSGAPTLTA